MALVKTSGPASARGTTAVNGSTGATEVEEEEGYSGITAQPDGVLRAPQLSGLMVAQEMMLDGTRLRQPRLRC